MKIKIKTFNGELPDYLVEDKSYELMEGYIINDDIFAKVEMGMVIPIHSSLKNCRHLNGGTWEIHNE